MLGDVPVFTRVRVISHLGCRSDVVPARTACVQVRKGETMVSIKPNPSNESYSDPPPPPLLLFPPEAVSARVRFLLYLTSLTQLQVSYGASLDDT